MATARPDCSAITTKGTRCKNKAKFGAVCGVHKNVGKGAKPGTVPLGKLAGRGGASKPAPNAGGGDMRAQLDNARSRDEAAAVLNRATVPQLRAFAADNNLEAPGRTKAEVVRHLVGQTMGARMSREAIRHDEVRDGIDEPRYAPGLGGAKPGGEERPGLAALARAKRAPAGRPKTSPADAATALEGAQSREEAAGILAGLTVPQLRAFAAERDLTPVGSTKKAIVDSLVDQTTGYKISSRTMQHEERDLPSVPGRSNTNGGGGTGTGNKGPASSTRRPGTSSAPEAKTRATREREAQKLLARASKARLAAGRLTDVLDEEGDDWDEIHEQIADAEAAARALRRLAGHYAYRDRDAGEGERLATATRGEADQLLADAEATIKQYAAEQKRLQRQAR